MAKDLTNFAKYFTGHQWGYVTTALKSHTNEKLLDRCHLEQWRGPTRFLETNRVSVPEPTTTPCHGKNRNPPHKPRNMDLGFSTYLAVPS